jgi:hypothetical protein
MAEVEVNVWTLGFCYVVNFNKGDKQSKQHTYLRVIQKLIKKKKIW